MIKHRLPDIFRKLLLTFNIAECEMNIFIKRYRQIAVETEIPTDKFNGGFVKRCAPVNGIFDAGSGTQTGLNYQPVQVTPLRQRYFDQNMFNLIKAQSANCTRVIERMGTPELHINDSNGVQMIFFFSVPVVLLESEKKENGRTGSFSTLGISDYSLYRKMTLSFDNNCNLKNAEYEATLKG
ncbi:hypothetical protein CHS0354_001967 [Potamilus streckersoni]|uniref:Uncharacterized protein n=1 Tax=Potamilus streckersoni TaxID=2493646 RepID=A0AAE0T5D7_9BIVA|nr:hypothetical protein CHS0354_001967 [Potamilus streckersoni]